MNRGSQFLLAASAVLVVASAALIVGGRPWTLMPVALGVLIVAVVAVAQVLMIVDWNSAVSDAKAAGQSPWSRLEVPRAPVIGAAAALVISAAVVAASTFAPLSKGSPGQGGYECEFYQVNKGAVTCVDETQWLRARAAEQAFLLGISAGFLAFQSLGFAATHRATSGQNPIWIQEPEDRAWG